MSDRGALDRGALDLEGIIDLQLFLVMLAIIALSLAAALAEHWRAEYLAQMRLRVTAYSAMHSLDELLVSILDDAEKLTGSQIGFFHFVHEDQSTVTLQSWSTRTTTEMCRAVGKGQHYSLDEGGVWVDCVRQRRPLIHNNYESLPHRKGLPEGHVKLVRDLVVPVVRRDGIVALLGVGNKQGQYDERDLESVRRLADVAWDVVSQKRSDEERQRMQNQMQYAQRLESLGVLAEGIAHDFNNIFAGIMGYAELVLRTIPASSPALTDVHEIKNAARRAAELTRQILAYAGKGKILVEPLDLSLAVQSLQGIIGVSVARRAAVVYQLAPALPAIQADASQISQLVLNLVMNAAEAVEGLDGEIAVSTDRMKCQAADCVKLHDGGLLKPGAYVRLTVSDTGRGMDPETAVKIFDPFFTTKVTGSGLGLAAVYGIVQGHEGAIQVITSPGQGTTVHVYFPLAQSGAE